MVTTPHRPSSRTRGPARAGGSSSVAPPPLLRRIWAWIEGSAASSTSYFLVLGCTLALTVISMVVGVALGAFLAVMRLSPNLVLRTVGWVYLWIFRGTPVYVQLLFWGLIFTIYRQVQFGIPFTDIDFIRFDEDGMITDFEVMMRPMNGVQALAAEMGARLGALLPAFKAS